MSRSDSSTRPATIREVAARAGVSTATVSRSLRGGIGVEPATRARVEDAARELRYRPSGVARSLKLRATHTLGLIVTDIENPYFPQIVSAVEDAAHDRGYSVLLADGRRDPERELSSLDLLGEREVDGLIIASTALTSRHRERIREIPCPVVIIDSESAIAAVPAVMADNEMGGWLAAQHVISLGHRHLAFVGHPDDGNSAVQARIDGAGTFLARRGARSRRSYRARLRRPRSCAATTSPPSASSVGSRNVVATSRRTSAWSVSTTSRWPRTSTRP